MSTPATIDPDSTRLRLAAEVRALMGRYQMNQEDLGKLIGVSQSQAGKRVRGVIAFDADEVGKIADYFGVSIGSLFGETSIAPQPNGPGGATGADDETRTRNILLAFPKVAEVVPLPADMAA